MAKSDDQNMNAEDMEIEKVLKTYVPDLVIPDAPRNVIFVTDEGVTFIIGDGFDPQANEDFVASDAVMHCPQYERLGDKNAGVGFDFFARHIGENRDIRLYLDQNIVTTILDLLDGRPIWDGENVDKDRKAVAEMLAFAGITRATLLYGTAVIEYGSNPKNTLEVANTRLARIVDAFSYPPQDWQRLALDAEYNLPTYRNGNPPVLPIMAEETTSQLAFYDTYHAYLKIAEIVINGREGMAAFKEFLDWIITDHQFSTATIAAAASQFLGQGDSPRPLKRMKHETSIKNENIVRRATWDLTHARTFNEMVQRDQDKQEYCYIFCTLEKGLQKLTNLVWSFATGGAAGQIDKQLGKNAKPAMEACMAAHARTGESGRLRDDPTHDVREAVKQLEMKVYGEEVNAFKWRQLVTDLSS